ncbi:hypothetical protein HMPREF0262_00414 [Clostridium sp. ATCC 29733]|nr:hypothetical protein HMPREF0262_00414 [Clostridium sp. ATCC 29733]
MFHAICTASDNLTGRPGDVSIVGIELRADQKAAQYVLQTVPSGLSFACIFIYVTTLSFFTLHNEEVIKTDDVADIFLIGKQAVNNRAGPSFFPFWGEDALLKNKNSDTLKAVTLQISLIDLLDYFCLLWFDENAVRLPYKSIRNVSSDLSL